jgi:hypothetical protein
VSAWRRGGIRLVPIVRRLGNILAGLNGSFNTEAQRADPVAESSRSGALSEDRPRHRMPTAASAGKTGPPTTERPDLANVGRQDAGTRSRRPLEAVNNKIKLCNRQALGYRNREFFEVTLLTLHESRYAFIGWARILRFAHSGRSVRRRSRPRTRTGLRC